MLTGLLAASLFAAAPSSVPPSPPSLAQLDERRFELHLGARGGLRAGGGLGFGGGAHVGLGVRLWRGLYLEAGVGEGVFSNPQPRASASAGEGFRHLGSHGEPLAAKTGAQTDPDAATGAAPTSENSPILAGQILLGLRYEVRTPRTMHIRPSVFVGATHLHEATIDDFLASPGKTLAGTGSFIRHRTGAQLGLGLRIPLPARWGPVAPRFSARFDADAAYYFDADPGRLQIGLGAGLQVVF